MQLSTKPLCTVQDASSFERELLWACKSVADLHLQVSASELSWAVYHKVYARGTYPPHRALWDVSFVEELMQATSERTRVIVGDRLGDQDDNMIVEIDGIRVAVPKEKVILNGAMARVKAPSASVAVSPGHVWIGGSQPTEQLSQRLYLAIVPSAAQVVLCDLADRLEDVTEGFWAAKVLAHPQHYVRADAGVVYVRPRDVEASVLAILDLVEGGCLELRDVSPSFTRRVTFGLSVACDPPDRTLSYGQWITQLLVAARSEDSCADKAVIEFKKLVVRAGRAAHEPWTGVVL